VPHLMSAISSTPEETSFGSPWYCTARAAPLKTWLIMLFSGIACSISLIPSSLSGRETRLANRWIVSP